MACLDFLLEKMKLDFNTKNSNFIYTSMKTIIITKSCIEKARKKNPVVIPASERVWSRTSIYKSGKEYQRHSKHRNRDND